MSGAPYMAIVYIRKTDEGFPLLTSSMKLRPVVVRACV